MKSQMKRAFWLICLLLAALAPAAAQGVLSAKEVVGRVREAVGYERLRSLTRGVAAAGTAHVRGIDSNFTFLFAPDGRFRTDVGGPLGSTSGFDGATGWAVDWSGMSRELELEDLEETQFEAWVQSGRWLAEDGPFTVSLDTSKTDDKQVALGLKLKNGLLNATIFIDRATWLPSRVLRRAVAGEEVFELSDYREVLGFKFSHHFTRTVGGLTSVYDVRSVAAAPASARSRFKHVTTRPADARWDASVPARIEARRAKTGHMLVHPLVNGKDAGWFILDSGAGSMVIDTKVADGLGMPALGETVAVGVSGTVKARFRQGESFKLGPVTLKDTRYLELDLGFLANVFGVPIGGVCGRDLFERAAVELDISTESVSLYNPVRYRLKGATWQELFFTGRNPVVRASFEGHEGLFRLDTGSGQTVSLHGPAVVRYNLLSGRETRASRSGGVGGSQATRLGKLAWLEIAGQRFPDLEAEFSSASEGAFSDVYTTGNIGAGILRKFRIVFDYWNKRVAFAPLKIARPAGAGAQ